MLPTTAALAGPGHFPSPFSLACTFLFSYTSPQYVYHGRKRALKFSCAAEIPTEYCRVKVSVMGGWAREEQDRVATVSEGVSNVKPEGTL
jgi:hypothetical protein